MSWIDFLENGAHEYGEKVAVLEQVNDRELTYFELNEIADRYAAYLELQGVAKGDRIAFLASNCLENLTILFACAKIGAIFVPINFRLAEAEVRSILKRIEPKLFFSKMNWEVIDGETYKFVDAENFVLPEEKNYTKNKSKLEDPILMLFTSGSTGEPKGVMLHGKMLKVNQEETVRNWGLERDDITLVETPFFHTGGYNVLCLPLLSIGAKVILAKKFSIENVLETFVKEKVSVYFAVPTMFQNILDHESFSSKAFESIRFFISGGAACSVEMIKKYQAFGVNFKQGFGLTEVGPNCFLLDEKDAILKAGSVGKPMPHSETLVIKKNGEIADIGETGELLLKGPHVCMNYYNESQRFKESLFDGYFKTGDLVYKDKDGFFYVVGRIKDMYISGGENVYPGEVEAALKEDSSIIETVIVPVESKKWGEVGFAFLQKEGDEYSLESLREFLNKKISRYKHPHYVEIVNDWPKLANGKIDRLVLKERAKKRLFYERYSF